MSDYSRQKDFSVKDALTTGDPDKVIKGSDVDEEFDAIVTAVATKLDVIVGATNGNVATVNSTGLVQDGGTALADLATKADYATLDSPTFTGTVTVPTPTADTDAATKAYADAAFSGQIVGTVLTDREALPGDAIPYDNSTPKNTEGDEITGLATAITPNSASSNLKIDVVVFFESDSGTNVTLSLFEGSGTNAIAAVGCTPQNNGKPCQVVLSHFVTAGSTTARTYRVRIGNTAGADIDVNGTSSSRVYGGVACSSMTILEI